MAYVIEKNLSSIIHLSKNSNSIGQRAAQTLCLIIFLPLILEDIVPKLGENFNKWKIILLLIKMLKIVLAPKITLNMLHDLQITIKEHHELVIKEYAVPLISKDHIITHYPMIIEKMGPPRIYWTMRFESKNGYFKDLAHTLKILKILHLLHRYVIKNILLLSGEINVIFWRNNPFFKILKGTFEIYKLCSNNCRTLQYYTFIYVGKSMKFRNTNLILNKFICTSFSKKFPNFGKTKLFFSINSTLFVLCESCTSVNISAQNFGYIIKNNSSLFIVANSVSII